MRSHSLRSVLSAFVVTLLLLVSHSLAFGQTTPKIEATVGTGSNVSYFVLDFLSGSAPQSYAFAYRYDGTKTGGDLIAALAAGVSGFTVQTTPFPPFGNLYDAFSYANKSIATPNGYWSYWLSTNGQNWTESQVGADGRTLTNGSWDGWSYAFNFATVAPTTPLAASATAAPEPGSCTLLAVGGITGAGIVLRRRRKVSGK